MKLHFPHGELHDIELSEGKYSIGNSDTADVTIKDKGLVGIHASLEIEGSEAYIVAASDATLISVQGKLVKGKREVRVNDRIVMAQLHCKVIEGEEEDDNHTKIRMALPKFILRGVSGPHFGKLYPLRGATVLGRHSECHICLQSEGVSRRHAELHVDEKGLRVKDLDSANGTFVNDEKVSEKRLQVGDELRFDELRFMIQTPGQAEEPKKVQRTVEANVFADDNAPEEQSVFADSDDTEPSSGGMQKWLIIGVILVAAIVAALALL